tara:strand:- start:489 stop:1532 length:1044 start_codon:yes stop_codon:yes gene_type:complete
MNYLILLVTILILLLVLDKYILHVTKSNIVSNYTKESGDYSNSIGFLKPEHRLLKILGDVSSGNKIKLTGKCTKFIYNKNTIYKELNDKLIKVLKEIIGSIQQISNDDFYIKTIENVYLIIDSKKNQRYFIDFFIYDVKNYYTIRLISDIVIVDNEIYINYLNVNTGGNNALLSKYDVKFRSAGILFDADMFHEDILKIFDNYYNENYKVIGISDTSLEYNTEDITGVFNMNSLKQLYFPSSMEPSEIIQYKSKGLSSYLEMFLPYDQEQKKSSLYGKKEEVVWDKFGIPINKSDSDNYVFNEHINFEVNQPWQGPGVLYDRVSDDKYKWLKDPSRKNLYPSKGYSL